MPVHKFGRMDDVTTSDYGASLAYINDIVYVKMELLPLPVL